MLLDSFEKVRYNIAVPGGNSTMMSEKRNHGNVLHERKWDNERTFI